MTERPRLSARLAAEIIEALPPRLARRLDGSPDVAEGWAWHVSDARTEVVAAAEAHVLLLSPPGGLLTSGDQVTCTCLLAPRCLHIAAVIARLEVDSEAAAAPAPERLQVEAGCVELSPGQRAAAQHAWQAASALLESGAQAAGLVLEAELLRVVHSCRVTGLHRLAGAGLRAAQQLRDLRARRPEFRLGGLAFEVYQVLLVAHRLMTADGVGVEWLGSARRSYEEIGSLRLTGIFCEAVVSGAGYAGVVTYVADQHGTLWSLGDVAPGDASRCFEAYATPVDLRDASIDHRELSRAGLYVQRATAAENRRLGSGRAVSAVRASGTAWTETPLASLWSLPLAAQVDRAFAARRAASRVAGDDLVFLRGEVGGATRDALLIACGSAVLRGVAPSAHAELPYRRNMQLLASAGGLEIWLVGRLLFSQPGTLALLAIGAGDLRIPDEWCGRVNFGLDTLHAGHLLPATGAALGRVAVAEVPAHVDPLDALGRRLQQILLGGRSAVSAATRGGFDRDEALLRERQMPTAAEVLRRLREAAPGQLAEAWLAARIYQSAAEGQLQRDAWLAAAT